MEKYILKRGNKPVITDKMKRIQLWHRYTLATMQMKLNELKKCPAGTGHKQNI